MKKPAASTDQPAAPQRTLDAFAFQPETASRIAGIGGLSPASDPAYVFHTLYEMLPPGPMRCDVRFSAFEATLGTMTIRVNSISNDAEQRVVLVKSWQIPLTDLVRANGEAMLAFEVSADARYAIMGHIYTEADAKAERLEIGIEAAEPGQFYEAKLATARKSVFGRKMFRRASRYLGSGKATLADPVSQMCTVGQFEEPVYDEWLARMKLHKMMHRKQWEFVYILQALERYGMLKPGARGLGFGVGIEPLPAVMAAAGCRIVATDLPSDDVRATDWRATNEHADSIDQLRHPQICDDATFDANVQFRTADMNVIPADLNDFDFTWSSCAYEHLGSIAAGLAFVQNSIKCLRPGGLAVHTTELNLVSDDATIDNEGTVLFRRRDMERLAVELVSHGHLVAQLKFDLGNAPMDDHIDVAPYASNDHLKVAVRQYVTTSFGIIVRRGER